MSAIAHVSTILGGRWFNYTFVELENKERPYPVFQLVNGKHPTKLDGKLYASWMFENHKGCTGTQTVSKKELYKSRGAKLRFLTEQRGKNFECKFWCQTQ